MLRLKQSGFVWSLLLCLVLVNGFLAVPAVAHADHHANTHRERQRGEREARDIPLQVIRGEAAGESAQAI